MKTSINQIVRITKATLLVLFVVIYSFSSQAQNRSDLLQETFNGNTMPAGWSIVGSGQSNWSISASHNAGGEVNEIKLYWNPQFNGTSRLVTPPINLTGVSSVVVGFKHALDNYSGSHTLGIATSTDGVTWHSGWNQNFASSGAWSVYRTISTEDMGSDNVKFCIYYTGNSYNINNWYFDDICIFTQQEIDVEMGRILVNDFVLSDSLPISFNVLNRGSATVNSLQVNYQIEGRSVVTEEFTNLNFSMFQTKTLTFEELAFLNPGNYNITIWISQVNGEAYEGNQSQKSVSVATSSVERKVMIEHFSSSTCGPCVSVNASMHTLTNNNPGKYCYVKYPMNWPGNGDPYYTQEGGVRRIYYAVAGVPYVVAEGGKYADNPALTQVLLNQFYEVSAFVDLRGSFTLEGNIIHVKVDVSPNITGTSTLFVTVNEKETHNNVGGNGENTFHHIMMKMLPNAEGTLLNFVAGETQSFEFTHDMSTTHVEEMTDLEVAIFVQSLETGEMLNSRFAYEYSELHPYPVENLQAAKEGTNINISWEAHPMTAPSGYKIKVNGALLEENYQGTSYTYENATGNLYAVQIEANYLEMTSVAVTKMVDMNAPEECQPVTALTATQDNHNVVLSWNAPANAVGFKILRNSELIAEVANVTSYSDIDVAEGTYTYGIITICSNSLESETTSTEIIVDYSAIDEILGSLKVYPNPAKEFVKIEGENIETVFVYNMLGQCIKTVTVNDNSADINIRDLNQGVYIFKIKQAGIIIHRSVVVSR